MELFERLEAIRREYKTAELAFEALSNTLDELAVDEACWLLSDDSDFNEHEKFANLNQSADKLLKAVNSLKDNIN